MNMTSLYLSPQAGGYVTVNNALPRVSSAINKMNVLLDQPIGGNIYDINNGNPLLTSNGISSAIEIVNALTFCFQPVLNSGDISNFSISSYTYTNVGKLIINLTAVLPNGLTIPLQWIR